MPVGFLLTHTLYNFILFYSLYVLTYLMTCCMLSVIHILKILKFITQPCLETPYVSLF